MGCFERMAKLTTGWQNSKILGHVFDQLSDALVLYDANHIITGVNSAAERMFSMHAEEIVGKDCREMFRCQMCDGGCGIQKGLNPGKRSQRDRAAPH